MWKFSSVKVDISSKCSFTVVTLCLNNVNNRKLLLNMLVVTNDILLHIARIAILLVTASFNSDICSLYIIIKCLFVTEQFARGNSLVIDVHMINV